MPLTTRVEPLSTAIDVIVAQTLSPPARRQALVRFARARLAAAQAQNAAVLGRTPPHTVTVDGRRGAPLAAVDPDRGVIVFEFDLIADLLRWIAQTLIARSPVVSGAYAKGHTLFADGAETAVGGRIPPAEEYAFTNMVPYARKIEIGRTQSGRPFVVQVENRIYERTARDARARFGNSARIEFTFRGVVGGRQIAAGTPGRAHNRSAVRFPTIVVRPR
jgi:hypothetical protein